jgi:hypothetical protein
MNVRAWITLALFGTAAGISMVNAPAGVGIILFCLILYIRPEGRPLHQRPSGRRDVDARQPDGPQ